MSRLSFQRIFAAVLLAGGVALAGCSDDAGGGQIDPGADAGNDLGGDAGMDATPDVEPDVEEDVEEDVTVDVSEDVFVDTGDDAGFADVGDDSGIGDDAGFADVGSDVGADTGDTGPIEPPFYWDDDDFDSTVGAWSSDYVIAGAVGEIGARVNAIAEDTLGNIYIGGAFTSVGGVPASNIAYWDGTTWHALGSADEGTHANIVVNAIAIDDDDNLCAGGDKASGGFGMPTNYVTCWDDENGMWSALGNKQVIGVVYATSFVDGELWIGGTFDGFAQYEWDTAEGPANLAVWDVESSAWVATSADSDGAVGGVRAITLDGDGDPCVGGSLSEVDGVMVGNVACLDAVDGWTDYGAGLDSQVNTLHHDGTTFYAGGQFSGGVATWSTDTWATFEGGVAGGLVTEVRSIVTDGDDVYVAGQFAGAGTGGGEQAALNVVVYRDSGWRDMDGGLDFTVGGVALNYGGYALHAETDGDVYVGGFYTVAGEIGAVNISKWNPVEANFEVVFDQSKQAVGTGGPVLGFAQDDVGNLVVGGQFRFIGSQSAGNIALRDSTRTWHTLGEGIGVPGADVVTSAAIDENGTIYAGGWFTEAGLLGANYFTWWNGESWRAAEQQLDGQVDDMAACGSNGQIVVVGLFENYADDFETVPAPGLAIFDGVDWSTIALAENEAYVGRAVACVAGDIYTEVAVTTLDEEENEITRSYLYHWDAMDESWSSLGENFGDPQTWRRAPFLWDIDVYDGTVYVSGAFRLIGDELFGSVAWYDDEAGGWEHLGQGLFNSVNGPASVIAIDAKENGVFATGNFKGSGVDITGSPVIPFSHVGWYDFESGSWNALGPIAEGAFGTYQGLNDLAESGIIHDGAFFVGGPFNATGGEPALGMGEWVYRPENPEE